MYNLIINNIKHKANLNRKFNLLINKLNKKASFEEHDTPAELIKNLSNGNNTFASQNSKVQTTSEDQNINKHLKDIKTTLDKKLNTEKTQVNKENVKITSIEQEEKLMAKEAAKSADSNTFVAAPGSKVSSSSD